MVNAHTHTHTHTHTHSVLDQQCLEWVIRFGSAVARCELVNGVLHIDYSGGISQQRFHGIDLAALRLRNLAGVALERMDKAFTAVGPADVCDAAWPPGTPPSAVIVNDAQYRFSADFCAQLADRGILRMAFLPHQVDHALRWAHRTRDAWLSAPCTR